MKNKIIALVLALILCMSLFAGCGSTAEAPAEAPVEDDTAATDSTEAAEPTVYTTFDYDAAYASYDPNAVVFTVNDIEITWEEYYGWLYSIIEQYEMYLGTEFAWEDLYSETMTLEDYAKYYTETMCAQYAIVNAMAKEAGLELTDDQIASIEELLASDAVNYTNGDVDAFVEFLESTYMDLEYYYYIQASSIYYQGLYEYYFGVDGDNISDEEVKDFINTNGFLYAKHILFLTQDSATGESLDDAAKAEKYALAEDTLAQLQACHTQEELLAKFDELMNSLSEDGGLASAPNGYYFLPGEMVTEFEEGTKALEPYSISDIIESAYGYHIILRQPITPDSIYDTGYSFRTLASQYAFDNMMSQKFTEAVFSYTEEFSDFSIANIMNTMEVTQ